MDQLECILMLADCIRHLRSFKASPTGALDPKPTGAVNVEHMICVETVAFSEQSLVFRSVSDHVISVISLVFRLPFRGLLLGSEVMAPPLGRRRATALLLLAGFGATGWTFLAPKERAVPWT